MSSFGNHEECHTKCLCPNCLLWEDHQCCPCMDCQGHEYTGKCLPENDYRVEDGYHTKCEDYNPIEYQI